MLTLHKSGNLSDRSGASGNCSSRSHESPESKDGLIATGVYTGHLTAICAEYMPTACRRRGADARSLRHEKVPK